MTKKLLIFLILVIFLGGCVSDPIKIAPGAKIIKPAKIQAINEKVGIIPGIAVNIPKEEVFSEDLKMEDPLTKKDVLRLINKPEAKKAFDAQIAREVDSEIREGKYEFWTKVTLYNFISILIGCLAWTLYYYYKNRTPEVNPFSKPEKKETHLVEDKKGLRVDEDEDEPTEF